MSCEFGDRFGHKVVFQVSAIVFITGSLSCSYGLVPVRCGQPANTMNTTFRPWFLTPVAP